MKNISNIALVAILFSVSTSIFSQENDTPAPVKTEDSIKTPDKTKDTVFSKLLNIPTGIASALLITTPNTVSNYTFKYALDKIAQTKYLQDSRFAKNTDTIGLTLVYLTALYATYKLYKYATAKDFNDDILFDYDDTTSTINN